MSFPCSDSNVGEITGRDMLCRMMFIVKQENKTSTKGFFSSHLNGRFIESFSTV